MGFLGRGIGTALLGPAGYVIGNQFDQEGKGGSSGPAPWNPITAQNTTISPDLAKTLGTVGTSAAGAIGANYAGAKSKLASDAAARGMSATKAVAPNSYAGSRLATTQGLDQGNLESALGGQLASTAYQDKLQQRDYGQQLSLAQQIADLNRPSTLQQIFQGIGAAGKTGAAYAGAAGGRGGSRSATPSSSGGGSSWNIMDPGPLDLGYGGGY